MNVPQQGDTAKGVLSIPGPHLPVPVRSCFEYLREFRYSTGTILSCFGLEDEHRNSLGGLSQANSLSASVLVLQNMNNNSLS